MNAENTGVKTGSAFDRIIGYAAIRAELEQLCDMIKNPGCYEKLGARLPQGVLLAGEPGLGKTLMSRCFIEESGLPCYMVRRSKDSLCLSADIIEAFEEAADNAPSIVFLDDMDKFANEDDDHRDAEEYVTVQSCIDDVRDKGVFVIATVNDRRKLPKSLTRSGRFDRKIEVECPNEEDAAKIIRYYLSDKAVADDVNLDDLTRMITYGSCAELETILNEAAVRAAFLRRDSIHMDDLIESVLRLAYDAPDDSESKERKTAKNVAYHEAGHVVVNEVLNPGSVGFATVRSNNRERKGGYIHTCKKHESREEYIMSFLAGKAADEMFNSGSCADGCSRDLKQAIMTLTNMISENGCLGLGLVNSQHWDPGDVQVRLYDAVHNELERYLFKTKEIILNNREFLEKICTALMEKGTLLYSDIQRIRSSCA